MLDDTSADDVVRPSRRELARRRRELLREPERLVTRREAADLIGVSLDTVDRRVRRQTGEGSHAVGCDRTCLPRRLPSSFRPVARSRAARSNSSAVDRRRIVSQRRGRIDVRGHRAALNEDGVATVHGGARWWPATVRKVVATAERASGRPSSGQAGRKAT